MAFLVSVAKAEEVVETVETKEPFFEWISNPLEKLAEAVADFTTSIDQNFLPQYCYYNRGVCYVQMLDYDSALNDFEKTLSVGDDENLIQGAKDILWQLVAYYENQAALTAAPEVQTADSTTIDEASGEPEAETVPVQ